LTRLLVEEAIEKRSIAAAGVEDAARVGRDGGDDFRNPGRFMGIFAEIALPEGRLLIISPYMSWYRLRAHIHQEQVRP
jgi:hypothetical protein